MCLSWVAFSLQLARFQTWRPTNIYKKLIKAENLYRISNNIMRVFFCKRMSQIVIFSLHRSDNKNYDDDDWTLILHHFRPSNYYRGQNVQNNSRSNYVQYLIVLMDISADTLPWRTCPSHKIQWWVERYWGRTSRRKPSQSGHPLEWWICTEPKCSRAWWCDLGSRKQFDGCQQRKQRSRHPDNWKQKTFHY